MTLRVIIVVTIIANIFPLIANAQINSAQQQIGYTINLPTQDLSSSLHKLANQTEVNIIFNPTDVANQNAAALMGRYSLQEALAKILEGTNLSAHYINADTVVIKVDDKPRGERSSETTERDRKANRLGAIVVTGYVDALTATRGRTPLGEIQQSVSVISREELDQQNATTLGSALKFAPGITLIRSNSQALEVSARGFDVTAVHIDGGAPIQRAGGVTDIMSRDLAEYERITILRGSDALFGGMGNPGATLSYKRKKPTPWYQSKFEADIGSWRQRRFTADISGPIYGKLTGRVVVAKDSRHYFFDTAKRRSRMAYGILKYAFSPDTYLELGGSWQKANSTQARNGLPRYEDGSDAHFDRSFVVAVPWQQYENTFKEAFIGFNHKFSEDWSLNANATYLNQNLPDALIASYSGPISLTTERLDTGFSATGGMYNNTQKMANATLMGVFDMLGYKQRMMFGVDYEKSSFIANVSIPMYGTAPIDPFNFDPKGYPAPVLSNPLAQVNLDQSTIQWGVYGSLRLQPSENASLVIGGRLSNYRQKIIQQRAVMGMWLPESSDSFGLKSHFTPYVGLNYKFGSHYTWYASFADIYHTNSGSLDVDHNRLPPVDGNTLETGIKGSWQGHALNASFALFKVEQRGVAVQDETITSADPNCCYISKDIKGRGFELNVTGYLAPDWMINAGYTYSLHRDLASSRELELPKHLLKLWTDYAFKNSGWSVGGGILARSKQTVRQCELSAGDGCLLNIVYGQGGYATVDLRAQYKFDEHWSAALSINNLFDRTYYQTLLRIQGGNWYGAPRNAYLAITLKY